MTEEEIGEVMGMLECSGMNPRLCDTPVEYVDVPVRAGTPAMPGDATAGEYLLLPKDMVGRSPMFVIDVEGDSMKDAGILPGDRLQIQVTPAVDDGDIVVASIDGECTVKAFFRDENGQSWLVPCNEKYVPIALREDMNVRILGRVVKHMREMPRVSHADMVHSIRRVEETPAPLTPGRKECAAIIAEVAPGVATRRQWYAVYRAFVDTGVVEQERYMAFVDMVSHSVPDHPHLPNTEVMRRMAVQSFRKPVKQWDMYDAPVTGVRFEAYMRIAKAVAEAVDRHKNGN